FFSSWILSKGLTSEIQTQQIVVAAVGQEAHFNCQLLQPKQVLQVTWQKVLPDGETNLGTCNKFFGQTVNKDFTDKVEFKNASLQSCFIVVRQLTQQDEGCYQCLSVSVHGVSVAGRTCLQVYELHEPVLHVGESDSAGESVVSCSATGRPAPTVTLNVTQQHLHFSHHDTVSINNNSTVTVTVTAVLSGFHGNSTQVGCAAQVLSGPQMEAFVLIPEVKPSDGSDDKSGLNWRDFRWPLIIVVNLMVAVCCVAVIMSRKTPQNRNIEMSEMFQEEDTQKTEEPSGAQDNSGVRKRSPTKTNQESNIEPSPSAARRIDVDQC
uniref:Immunoglobulin domain-containing protein n=1 Tax=Amphiprion percula TaxID=161767 RepID=A0A3P8TE20_AMPPE